MAGDKAVTELEDIIAGKVRESDLIKTTVERIASRFGSTYRTLSGGVAQVVGQVNTLVYNFEDTKDTEKALSKEQVETRMQQLAGDLKQSCLAAGEGGKALREEIKSVAREAQKFPGMEETLKVIENLVGAAKDLDNECIGALTAYKKHQETLKKLLLKN